jgi:hypothetical protein
VWLAWQIGRTRPGSDAAQRHGLDLERTLRGLLKEADLASSSLNDQLIRRQQSLERLLRDIEATEVRLERNRTGAPAAASERGSDTTPRPQTRSTPTPSSAAPQPPSFAAVAKTAPARSRKVETNIYGEPIGEVTTAPAPTTPPPSRVRSPLAESIEKEIIPNAPASPPPDSAAAIAEVRRAAEALLRAGRDLEFVAQRTRLPLEEVRLLSQLVVGEIEQRARQAAPEPAPTPARASPPEVPPAPEAKTDDPRLGVLSPIRRSIETV